jgi:hypothetical protein
MIDGRAMAAIMARRGAERRSGLGSGWRSCDPRLSIPNLPSHGFPLRPAGLRRPLRAIAPLLLVAGLGAGLVACGDDDDGGDAAASRSTSPEEHFAPDAEVTVGLGKMKLTATDVKSTVAGGSAVEDADEKLEADWIGVEGTVKRNEPDLYADIEEAMVGIADAAKAKNTGRVDIAVGQLTTAIDAYLAKHP